MNWRSHAVIGVAFALIALLIYGTRDIFSLVILGVIGGLSALAPDLDHDASKGRQLLDVSFISFALLSAIMSECGRDVCLPTAEQLSQMATVFFAMVGMYFVFFKFLKPEHRGITHTILATAVFGVLMYLFAGMEVAIAGFAGYFSHLVADRHIELV